MRGLSASRVNACGRLIGIALLMLSGCASQPLKPRLLLPEPRLAPAAFGGSVSLVQRLAFEAATALPDQPARQLDAQLEIDADEVRLAAVALGQRILTLRWDGTSLDVQRHPQLPAQVDPARVLRDVQYAYWPIAALRAALPEGWTLDDADQRRQLRHAEQLVLSIRYDAVPRWTGTAELDNRVEGYRLSIASSLIEAATP